MTTLASPSRARVLAPPTERYSLLGWIHKNLFGSRLDALLTLFAVALLYGLLKPLLTWALTTAEWAVIPANFTLFLRGPYPEEAVNRVWICLYLLGAMVGLCWGVWSNKIRPVMILIFATPLVLALIPFLETRSRMELGAIEATLVVAYIIGRIGARLIARILPTLLVFFFVAVILILRGIGALTPIVETSLWGGLLLTLVLSVLGIGLSFPLGVLLALGRRSKLPAIRLVSVIYIEFIRGVPLISLLFMGQAMLQLFLPAGAPTIDRMVRALVAITLFSAAYTAENVRGGLQAIPRGQFEAAYALGLSPYQTMRQIILPQALRAVIPVLVGQFIGLFKDTSLVALVGLFDLLGIARTILANPNWLGKHQEVYLFIGIIFWIFCYTMSYASRRLERSLGVGER